MALETRTIAEINDLIINQIEAQIGQTIPVLPKAFVRILAKVIAGMGIILYKVAGWIFLQLFVSTASFRPVTILGKTVIPLIEWGKLVGVGEPDNASSAVLEIDLTVLSFPNTLLSGTQFRSPITGTLYLTLQDYTLSSGSETIEVTAVSTGEIGNLDDGDNLQLVNDLGFIESEAIVSDMISEGVEAESEASYRQKVSDRFKLTPQGGALSDYRIWGNTVTGVAQIYPYTGDPASNVLVYVEADDPPYTGRIPTSGLLIQVGEAIDFDDDGQATRRPVTAIIDPAGDGSYGNVLPITVKNFEVEITDLTLPSDVDENTVLSQIEAALDEYFLEREPYINGLSRPPAKNVVSLVNVTGIVDDIVNANNGSFLSATLTSETIVNPLYVLGEGELCKLNGFTNS
jgi:hypothetical protein